MSASDVLTAGTTARRKTTSLVTEFAVVATMALAGLLISYASLIMTGPWFPLAFVLLVCLSLVIFVKPMLGIYLTVFLALVGDGPTMEWYPFGLNFSSRQSILFLHDSLTVSPIELYLAITVLAWFNKYASERQWRLEGRPVLWPMAFFVGLVALGFVWGIFVNGGDLTIAIWELRPLLYMPTMFFLTSQLFTRTTHYVHLAIVAVAAISVQNLLALRHYLSLDPVAAEELEGLTEHAASIHYDWLFVLMIALLTIRHSTPGLRFLVTLAALPTIATFVLSQRRAAVVALVAGLLVYFVILLFRQRATFFTLFPATVVMAIGYTLAFWNSSSGIGFGARAIKTVIASDELSDRDSSSNVYRLIENYNLLFTIQNNRLLGVGFGRPFEQPAALPDISFFVFFEFIPHNSILWIWLKTGYLGFVTLLVIVAFTLRAGTRAAMILPRGNVLAVTIAALAYIVMFLVFAYVDIAWDSRSTLFLGTCIALCANIVRLWEHEQSGDVAPREAPPDEIGSPVRASQTT